MGYKGPIERIRRKTKAAMRRWRKKPENKLKDRLRGNRRTKEGYYRAKRAKLQAWIDELKSVPCTDCTKSYNPWVMEFDHVRGKKDKGIAAMVSQCLSRERIHKEIEKCEIVCSNCHRERTWIRKHKNQAIPIALIRVD